MTVVRPSTSLAPVDGSSRLSFARIADVMNIPNLIQVQRDSFQWFRDEGLKELFAEISPIQDFTGRNLELILAQDTIDDGKPVKGYRFDAPKCSEHECRERDTTYAAPLRVRARLVIKQTGEIKEQDIFMGDFPLMTENGTFVINGAERVVVSQLVRSPGVYFTVEEDSSLSLIHI